MKFVVGLSCLVCLLAVSVDAMSDMEMKMMMDAKDKCSAEVGLEHSVLEEMHKTGDFTHEKLPCFIACMMKTFGIMSDDGHLLKDEAIKKIPSFIDPDHAKELINLCMNKEEADPCATAAMTMKCVMENKKDDLFHMKD